MNQFSPANLSPLPISPVPCALPFGLAWRDLAPCLVGWNGREDDNYSLQSYEKQGLHKGGNSCIVTLRYTDGDHTQRETTVFIKHSNEIYSAEAARYVFLASKGVPVPRLLATSQREEHEVIVTEFLPTIGIDLASASHITALLELLAHVNATPASISHFQLPPGRPHDAFNASVRAALVDLSGMFSDVDAEPWFAAYKTVCEIVSSLPTALTHGEFSYQQVGWAQRGKTRVLVVFDLATMAHRPRFFDIASLLPSLAKGSARRETEVLDIYLRSLRRFGSVVQESEREVLHEVRLTRTYTAIQSLPWLVHGAQHTSDYDFTHILASTVHSLRSDLMDLGYSQW